MVRLGKVGCVPRRKADFMAIPSLSKFQNQRSPMKDNLLTEDPVRRYMVLRDHLRSSNCRANPEAADAVMRAMERMITMTLPDEIVYADRDSVFVRSARR